MTVQPDYCVLNFWFRKHIFYKRACLV
jgi:hypothetical protein